MRMPKPQGYITPAAWSVTRDGLPEPFDRVVVEVEGLQYPSCSPSFAVSFFAGGRPLIQKGGAALILFYQNLFYCNKTLWKMQEIF